MVMPCFGVVEEELTVVSAANGRYSVKELAILLEVRQMGKREGMFVRLISYDLGGMGQCVVDGKREASWVWSEFGILYRRFDFSKYPAHVSNLACYAWKAPIVYEVAREFPGSVVIWVDSGVAFHKSLGFIVRDTRNSGGFSSDETARSVARFSHEKTLDYFIDHFHFDPLLADIFREKRRGPEKSLDEPLRNLKNCNGAFSAHLYGSPKFTNITEKWLQCSLDKSCVCPAGSSRANHRQDQAALTLLAINDGYSCAHRKVVSAHGLRHHDLILEKHGIISAEKSDKTTKSEDPFCSHHHHQQRIEEKNATTPVHNAVSTTATEKKTRRRRRR